MNQMSRYVQVYFEAIFLNHIAVKDIVIEIFWFLTSYLQSSKSAPQELVADIKEEVDISETFFDNSSMLEEVKEGTNLIKTEPNDKKVILNFLYSVKL